MQIDQTGSEILIIPMIYTSTNSWVMSRFGNEDMSDAPGGLTRSSGPRITAALVAN